MQVAYSGVSQVFKAQAISQQIGAVDSVNMPWRQAVGVTFGDKIESEQPKRKSSGLGSVLKWLVLPVGGFFLTGLVFPEAFKGCQTSTTVIEHTTKPGQPKEEISPERYDELPEDNLDISQ